MVPSSFCARIFLLSTVVAASIVPDQMDEQRLPAGLGFGHPLLETEEQVEREEEAQHRVILKCRDTTNKRALVRATTMQTEFEVEVKDRSMSLWDLRKALFEARYEANQRGRSRGKDELLSQFQIQIHTDELRNPLEEDADHVVKNLSAVDENSLSFSKVSKVVFSSDDVLFLKLYVASFEAAALKFLSSSGVSIAILNIL